MAVAQVASVVGTAINDHRGLIHREFGASGDEFLALWDDAEQIFAYYSFARGGAALVKMAASLPSLVKRLPALVKKMRSERALLKAINSGDAQEIDQMLNRAETLSSELEKIEAAQNAAPKAGAQPADAAPNQAPGGPAAVAMQDQAAVDAAATHAPQGVNQNPANVEPTGVQKGNHLRAIPGQGKPTGKPTGDLRLAAKEGESVQPGAVKPLEDQAQGAAATQAPPDVGHVANLARTHHRREGRSGPFPARASRGESRPETSGSRPRRARAYSPRRSHLSRTRLKRPLSR